MPQSKSTELCSSAAVVPQSKSTELCCSAAPFHHITCDIYGTEIKKLNENTEKVN